MTPAPAAELEIGHGDDPLATAKSLVRSARAICVLTGAGISTDSGIPDFRGPQGIWTRTPDAQRLSTLAHYLSSPQVRSSAWQQRLHPPAPAPRPSGGHLALVEIERQGRLEMLVTQNVDGLHLVAGTSPERLVELHGSLRECVCLSCQWRGPMVGVLERVRHGDEDPACQVCGGILKSAAVSFGQRVATADRERAEQAARGCDLMLVVGTRLEVFPAAELPAISLAAGAKLVIVNAEPTSYDRRAHAVVRRPIGQALPVMIPA